MLTEWESRGKWPGYTVSDVHSLARGHSVLMTGNKAQSKSILPQEAPNAQHALQGAGTAFELQSHFIRFPSFPVSLFITLN